MLVPQIAPTEDRVGRAKLIGLKTLLIEAHTIARRHQALPHLHDSLRLRRRDPRQAHLRFQEREKPQRPQRRVAQCVSTVPSPFAIEIEAEANPLHRALSLFLSSEQGYTISTTECVAELNECRLTTRVT